MIRIRNRKAFLNKLFFTIALILCAFLILNAQFPNLSSPHNTLNKSNGLSDEYITCMTKDSSGYMWIGTRNGLCRYDGSHVETWTNNIKDSMSISDNWIISLYYEESRNILWVGTAKGLSFLNLTNYQFSFPSAKGNSKFNIATEWITGILCDEQNDFWLYNLGLHLYDPLMDQRISYTAPYNEQTNLIVQVLQDQKRNNILWLATMNGYVKFNKKTKSFEGHYYYKHKNKAEENRLNQVELFLYQHDDGKLYGGGYGGGLTIFDPITEKVSLLNTKWNGKKLSNKIFYKSIIRISEELLCIVSSEGVIWYNPSKNEVENYIKNTLYNTKTIIPTYIDENQRIWISSNNGLDIYDPYFSQLNFLKFDDENIPEQCFIIKSIEDLENKRLLLIENGGSKVYVYNIENQKYDKPIIAYDDVNHKEFQTVDIIRMKNNEILLLSKSNVYKRVKDKWIILDIAPILKMPPYTSITEGENEDLFLMSIYNGVFHYSTITDSIKHYGNACFVEDGWWIYDSFFDTKGRLWVNHLDIGFGMIDLPNDSCYSVQIDKNDPNHISRFKDHLWFSDSQLMVCGGGQGLGLIDRDSPEDGISKKFNIGEFGMVTDNIYAIEYDNNGHIWMLCDIGLQVFDKDKNTFKFFSYSTPDFILKSEVSDQFLFQSLENGKMVFGVDNGLVFFNPNSLYQNKEQVLPQIVDIHIFDEVLEKDRYENKNLTLNYDENFITFQFSGINYTASNKTSFKYKLNGIDHDWNNSTGQNMIKYAHLDPGDYTFQLKVANNDHIWSNKRFSLNLNILPPWWKTWWAYLLFLSIFILSLYLWFQSKKRKWKLASELDIQKQKIHTLKKQKELDLLNAIIKGEEKERMRLSRELHDSVGAMVASIKMFFQTILEESSVLNEDKNFLYAKNLISKTYDEVRSISHNLMPMDVVELGIKQAINDLCKNYSNSSDTNYECQIFIENDQLNQDIQLNLYRIIQEVVKNVSVHANARSVFLQLNIDNEYVHLEIENDGDIFNVEEAFQKKGIGLKNIRTRVDFLKGELDILSNKKVGTLISVIIPL